MSARASTCGAAAGALAALAAGAVLSLSSASAAATSPAPGADPRGDVSRVGVVFDAPELPSTDDQQVDITRTTTRLTRSTLTVAVDVARLRGTGWFVDARIADPSGQEYHLGYSTFDRGSAPYFYTAAHGARLRRGCGTPGLALRAEADQVVMSVPRTCVGSPSWVRTGVLTGRWIDDSSWRVDDARRDGEAPNSPDRSRLGPRVRLR